jgi:TRAP transporter 4TM/12TM fusion protein
MESSVNPTDPSTDQSGTAAETERTTNRRDLKGATRRVVSIIAVLMSLFHLYTAGFGVLGDINQRAVHLMFTFALIFLAYAATPHGRHRVSPGDIGLAIFGSVAAGYLVFHYEYVVSRELYITPILPIEWVLAIATVLLVLEASRRTNGWPLPLVATAFLVYAFVGPYLPGLLSHRGVPPAKLVDQLYLTVEGIFGIALAVSATFVFLFILFGSFLEKSGTGEFFIDLSKAMVGDMRGGPAKMAVVASGMFGTISGSAVANVMTTGTFTIPLMKRLGYTKDFAGAVEAVASTGGQIMPPVMGAAAFVLAEFTGTPYLQVCIYAAIPAVLFYLAVGIMVHFEACKLGIKGLPKNELPSFKPVLWFGWHLFLPLVGIVFFLFRGYTPLLAGFYAVLLTVGISAVRKATRMGPRKVYAALEAGALSAISVAAACAAAGIVIGVVNLTGLGLRFSSLIIGVSGGHLLLALFLTMIASLILGMGLPTTPAYVIQAALAVPALVNLGVPVMAAHLFCLYFAVISAITPPVALAAYAGASLSGGNAMMTGFIATRLGLAAYIIPYMFVYGPALLTIGEPLDVLLAFVTALVGVVGLAAAGEGWLLGRMVVWERLLTLGSALLLIKPGWMTDLAGLILFGAVALSQFRRHGLQRRQVAIDEA